jgi:hypothetical protein
MVVFYYLAFYHFRHQANEPHGTSIYSKAKRALIVGALAKNNRINVNPSSIRKPLSSLPANPICHFSINHMADEALSHYIRSFHVDAHLRRDILYSLS